MKKRKVVGPWIILGIVEFVLENVYGQYTKTLRTFFKYVTRPDPLSAVDYIELMIKSEGMEKQPGYLKRIEMLQNIKKSALVDQEVASLSRSIQITRENVKSATGKSHYQNISKRVNNKCAGKRSFHDVTGLF